MGTPPLEKNGRDQAQDRDLREIRGLLLQNDKDHSAIKDVLSDLKLAVSTTNERIHATRTVAVVVWTLFLVALGGIGWVVNQAADVIKDVSHEVQSIDRRQEAHIEGGKEWGRSLENGVQSNKEEIHDLQRLHRIRPGKD